MRTNTSPAARPTVACPKCAGTGIVSAFLDYKGGECFDCNGTGLVLAPVAAVVCTLSRARKIGDMAIQGSKVAPSVAAGALDQFTEYGLHRFSERDYHRQRALLAIVNG